MNTPICSADTRRDALCRECKKKLEEGSITELDVKISRALQKLSRHYLIDIDFKKALEMGDVVVMVCTGNIGSLIGKKGRIVSELGKELGRKMRVIEKVADEKKMIQDLVGNARVLAVDKVFKVDGKEHKIKIPKQDSDRLIAEKPVLEKAIAAILKTDAKIEFV